MTQKTDQFHEPKLPNANAGKNLRDSWVRRPEANFRNFIRKQPLVEFYQMALWNEDEPESIGVQWRKIRSYGELLVMSTLSLLPKMDKLFHSTMAQAITSFTILNYSLSDSRSTSVRSLKIEQRIFRTLRLHIARPRSALLY